VREENTKHRRAQLKALVRRVEG